MKTRLRFALFSLPLVTALLFLGLVRPSQASPGPEVDISVFITALAPYGTWVDHVDYGRVWYPREIPYGWRPYTHGHWAYTPDCGWVWLSDWAWGWAPFHYGRWVRDPWYGWIWIPGRVWAPAWVFWRYGGGYIAWAPMPPHILWRPGLGLYVGSFNLDRDSYRDSWVAVPERHFPARRIDSYVLPPQQNVTLINVTKNVTNLTMVNQRIVNRSIPVRQIDTRLHLLQQRQLAGRHNGLELRGQIFTDVGELSEVFTPLQQHRDARRVTAYGARRIAVGTDSKGVGALDIQQIGELVEELSNLGIAHRKSLQELAAHPPSRLPVLPTECRASPASQVYSRTSGSAFSIRREPGFLRLV